MIKLKTLKKNMVLFKKKTSKQENECPIPSLSETRKIVEVFKNKTDIRKKVNYSIIFSKKKRKNTNINKTKANKYIELV